MQGAASVFFPSVKEIESLREEDCKADICSCWKAVGDDMRAAFGYLDEAINGQHPDKDK